MKPDFSCITKKKCSKIVMQVVLI